MRHAGKDGSVEDHRAGGCSPEYLSERVLNPIPGDDDPNP
jgi:hypothetical protein